MITSTALAAFGAKRIISGGGGGSWPVAAGVRATATNVGYNSSYGALTTYNAGGAAPTGWHWDTGTLVSSGGGATLNLCQINGNVVCDDSGGATITKCVINSSPNDWYGVTLAGTSNGTLTVTDTTIVGASTGSPQLNGISSDDGLIATRCHVTNTGDGIHFVSNGSVISQCYVGPLRFIDEEQHLDGLQGYQDDVNGSFTLEHSYVEYTESTIGTPMNSAITFGPPITGGPLVTPTLNNNYFGGGLYTVRFNFQTRNAVVTNNNWGPDYLFANHDFDPGNGNTYATWSNNRDSTNTLIPAP